MEHLFLSIDLRSDAHQNQIIGLKLLGGYTVKLLGGYISPSPPCLGTTAHEAL